MDVHLIDGTYELFRHFFALPPHADDYGNEVGAVCGVLNSVVALLREGATHVGVATDHVIESFRNELYSGYKTAEGVPAKLLAQFPIVEEALQKMGVAIWPMVEYEADDALASAASRAARDARVRQVILCTPDKDLAQCVVGSRIVQLDRRRGLRSDEAGVVAKFGIRPESIPDYLALVGDSADGFPGLPGWGPKSAALTFARYAHLEDIPQDWRLWDSSIRGAARLSEVLRNGWGEALLFRNLATLRCDIPLFETVEELKWNGPGVDFEPYCVHLRNPELYKRALSAARETTEASR